MQHLVAVSLYMSIKASGFQDKKDHGAVYTAYVLM